MPNPTGRGYATELLPPGVATYVVVTGDDALGVAVLAVLAPVDLHVRKSIRYHKDRIRVMCTKMRASRRLVHCCYTMLYISTSL